MADGRRAIPAGAALGGDGGASVPFPARRRGPLRRLGAFARRNKLGALGVVVVLTVVLAALLSPFIARYGDNETFETANPEFDPTASPIEIARNPSLSTPTILDRYRAPSAEHWFGTDQFGRDIYARIVVGARQAVFIGLGGALLAVAVGTAVAVASGYLGGPVDLVVQRFVDALQAFPGIVLLLLVVQATEEPGLWQTVAALAVLGTAGAVRVVRASVLSVRAQPYIEGARATGATDLRIMLRHVLPNTAAAVLVMFTVTIGVFILAEASLSFLGLGPAETTWGKMVSSGRNTLDLHPWEALFAGGAITLAVLGFNLAGDAIRDELDPRLRGR